jgi:hypothetical protein
MGEGKKEKQTKDKQLVLLTTTMGHGQSTAHSPQRILMYFP